MSVETLAKIIANVESNNHLKAVRFEPKLFTSWKNKLLRFKRIEIFNKCNWETALMIGATSWGKYQILGYNLWEMLGYDHDFIMYLCSEDHQDKMFRNFISIIAKESDVEIFCDKILKQLEFLKLNKVHELGNRLKEFLKETQKYITTLTEFIRKYNGAVFGSQEYMDYLLRMLYHYKKLEGGS